MTRYERIYSFVKKIPKGRVATYGQIARLAGIPQHARQVGYALHALKDNRLPWHRVINAQAQVSARAETFFENEQRQLLENEGIVFDANHKVSLKRFGWKS